MLPLQESPEKKATWLKDAKQRLPIHSRVIIFHAQDESVEKYVGRLGTVVGYELGELGEWPKIEVLPDGFSHKYKDTIYFYSDGHGSKDDEIATPEQLWIDRAGRKPTAEELDAFLAISAIDIEQALAFIEQTRELML